MLLFLSECHVEAEADAPFLWVRVKVEIRHTADIFYGKYLKDILQSDDKFYIRLVVHDVRLGGEAVQLGVAGIACEERVVLICEVSPQALYGHIFSQLEFFYQRNAVQYLSVHVPAEGGPQLAVVDELPVG